jgi:hypothetical protein
VLLNPPLCQAATITSNPNRPTVRPSTNRKKNQPNILALLVLPETQANPSAKAKEPFFAHAPIIIRILAMII